MKIALSNIWRSLLRPKRTYLAVIMGVVISGVSFQASEAPSFKRVYHATFSNNHALNSLDIAHYKALFAAQAKGDWETADNALMQLQDQRLMGTVLAQRYLSSNYRASQDELLAWLGNYSDQPEASLIRALAKRKGASETDLVKTASPAAIQGIGRVDTMGNADMPESWYRGLSQWKSQNPQAALQAFNNASAQKGLQAWQRAAIAFWQYRAHEKLGNDTEAEAALLRAAEAPRTFYGMLANETLGTPLALTALAPYVPETMRTHPSVLRAQALSQLSEYRLAEKELRHLYKRTDKENRPALITIASELNLPNLQVRLGQAEGLSDEEAVFASYPMPNWLTEDELCVDSALMFAISRQESSFATEVKSHAGATGLMQLMPATANYIWRKSSDSLVASLDQSSVPESMSRIAPSDLHDPKTNMLLGQEYLLYLMNKAAADVNLVHVVASYNAGPGMVAVWNKNNNYANDPLLYIEHIPYKETRHYVMQVLSNYWAYQSLMGKRTDSLTQLSKAQWPTFAKPAHAQ